MQSLIRNIVTTVVTGGVSMIIIFAIDKTIFSPGFMNKDYKPAAEEQK